MRNGVALCVVVLVSALLIAQSRVNSTVINAHTMLICTEQGPDVAPNRIPLDEQRALADVEERMRQWGRFVLTNHEQDADLIMVIRKGGVSVQIGGGGPPIPGVPPSVRTQRGPSSPVDDVLEVYDGRGVGMRGAPLWSDHERGGLNGKMSLVTKFQRQVDQASPKP